MRKIILLGSTGSIGTQTLAVIREHQDIEVTAMSCGRNLALFEKQIREFHPKRVCTATEELARQLRLSVRDLSVEITYGSDGLIHTAQTEGADLVVTAIVGMMGILPTIAAMKAGKNIALANKETLVAAGHLILPLAKEYQVSIFPVDSEHSAIFQCLSGEEGNPISKILLTASGGPFRGKSKKELQNVNLKDALAHPNWSMGPKVTVDSSTMVNKGLEMIEAKWLFDLTPDQIEVVVHPQSIVHSAVEFEDGAVIAQLGLPDMRLPIQYALYYPKRPPLSGRRLNLFELGNLTFERPDTEAFPGLELASLALRRGGNLPVILNAANEKAVSLFLEQKIRYPDIMEYIAEAMQNCTYVDHPDLGAIFETEQEVHDYIEKQVTN